MKRLISFLTVFLLVGILGVSNLFAQPPGTQTHSLSVTTISSTGVTFSFTNGEAADEQYMVVAYGGAPNWAAYAATAGALNTALIADVGDYGGDLTAALADADNVIVIGSVTYVVVDIDGSALSTPNTISNLSPSTLYYVHLFLGNNDDGDPTTNEFNTSSAANNPISFWTAPTTAPSNLTFTNITATGATLNFTAGSGDGRMIVYSTTAIANNPVYATDYSTTTGSTTNQMALAASDDYVIGYTTGTSFTITGTLTAATLHNIRVYEYENTATLPTFKTDAYASGSFTTNPTGGTTPSTQARYIAFSNISNTTANATWINGNGYGRFVVLAHGGTPDWSLYAANARGTGLSLNSLTMANVVNANGNYTTAIGDADNTEVIGGVTYTIIDRMIGTNNSTAMINLPTPNIAYYVHVFEYNNNGTTANFNMNNGVAMNPRSFTTTNAITPPSTLASTTPVGRILTLSWAHNGTAGDSYRLYVSTGSGANFDANVVYYSGFDIGNGTAFDAYIPANGTYYWKLKKEIAGQYSAYSSEAYFIVTDATLPEISSISFNSTNDVFTVVFSKEVTPNANGTAATINAGHLTITCSGGQVITLTNPYTTDNTTYTFDATIQGTSVANARLIGGSGLTGETVTLAQLTDNITIYDRFGNAMDVSHTKSGKILNPATVVLDPAGGGGAFFSYTTIQKAVDAATTNNGDIIYLKDSYDDGVGGSDDYVTTYSENVNLNKSLQITDDNLGGFYTNAIISGVWTVTNGVGTTLIDRLTFTGNNGITLGAIAGTATVDGCTFTISGANTAISTVASAVINNVNIGLADVAYANVFNFTGTGAGTAFSFGQNRLTGTLDIRDNQFVMNGLGDYALKFESSVAVGSTGILNIDGNSFSSWAGGLNPNPTPGLVDHAIGFFRSYTSTVDGIFGDINVGLTEGNVFNNFGYAVNFDITKDIAAVLPYLDFGVAFGLNSGDFVETNEGPELGDDKNDGVPTKYVFDQGTFQTSQYLYPGKAVWSDDGSIADVDNIAFKDIPTALVWAGNNHLHSIHLGVGTYDASETPADYNKAVNLVGKGTDNTTPTYTMLTGNWNFSGIGNNYTVSNLRFDPTSGSAVTITQSPIASTLSFSTNYFEYENGIKCIDITDPTVSGTITITSNTFHKIAGTSATGYGITMPNNQLTGTVNITSNTFSSRADQGVSPWTVYASNARGIYVTTTNNVAASTGLLNINANTFTHSGNSIMFVNGANSFNYSNSSFTITNNNFNQVFPAQTGGAYVVANNTTPYYGIYIDDNCRFKIPTYIRLYSGGDNTNFTAADIYGAAWYVLTGGGADAVNTRLYPSIQNCVAANFAGVVNIAPGLYSENVTTWNSIGSADYALTGIQGWNDYLNNNCKLFDNSYKVTLTKDITVGIPATATATSTFSNFFADVIELDNPADIDPVAADVLPGKLVDAIALARIDANIRIIDEGTVSEASVPVAKRVTIDGDYPASGHVAGTKALMDGVFNVAYNTGTTYTTIKNFNWTGMAEVNNVIANGAASYIDLNNNTFVASGLNIDFDAAATNIRISFNNITSTGAGNINFDATSGPVDIYSNPVISGAGALQSNINFTGVVTTAGIYSNTAISGTGTNFNFTAGVTTADIYNNASIISSGAGNINFGSTVGTARIYLNPIITGVGTNMNFTGAVTTLASIYSNAAITGTVTNFNFGAAVNALSLYSNVILGTPADNLIVTGALTGTNLIHTNTFTAQDDNLQFGSTVNNLTLHTNTFAGTPAKNVIITGNLTGTNLFHTNTFNAENGNLDFGANVTNLNVYGSTFQTTLAGGVAINTASNSVLTDVTIGGATAIPASPAPVDPNNNVFNFGSATNLSETGIYLKGRIVNGLTIRNNVFNMDGGSAATYAGYDKAVIMDISNTVGTSAGLTLTGNNFNGTSIAQGSIALALNYNAAANGFTAGSRPTFNNNIISNKGYLVWFEGIVGDNSGTQCGLLDYVALGTGANLNTYTIGSNNLLARPVFDGYYTPSTFDNTVTQIFPDCQGPQDPAGDFVSLTPYDGATAGSPNYVFGYINTTYADGVTVRFNLTNVPPDVSLIGGTIQPQYRIPDGGNTWVAIGGPITLTPTMLTIDGYYDVTYATIPYATLTGYLGGNNQIQFRGVITDVGGATRDGDFNTTWIKDLVVPVPTIIYPAENQRMSQLVITNGTKDNETYSSFMFSSKRQNGTTDGVDAGTSEWDEAASNYMWWNQNTGAYDLSTETWFNVQNVTATTWSHSLNASVADNYQMYIKATDAAGNISTITRNFVVDNVKPKITSLAWASTSSVVVTFDKAVESLYAEMLANYTITLPNFTTVTPTGAVRSVSPNDNVVTLTFAGTPFAGLTECQTLLVEVNYAMPNGVRDLAGNLLDNTARGVTGDINTGLNFHQAKAYRPDVTAPTVVSISRNTPVLGSAPYLTNSASVSYTVVFSEAVYHRTSASAAGTALTAADFDLSHAVGTIGTVTTSDNITFVVPVTVNATADGELLTVNPKTTLIYDNACGQTNHNAYSGHAITPQTYKVDRKAPVFIANFFTHPTTGDIWNNSAKDVEWDATKVSDGGSTDANTSVGFHYSLDGSTSWTYIGADVASGSPLTWNVNIPAGNYPNAKVRAVATDEAGNISEYHLSNTFTLNHEPLTCVITRNNVTLGDNTTKTTTDNTIKFTLTFNKALIGFAAADVTVQNDPVAVTYDTYTVVNTSGNIWEVTFTNVNGNGTLGITVVKDGFTDVAGTMMVANVVSALFTIDNTAPALSSLVVACGNASATVTYTEPVYSNNNATGVVTSNNTTPTDFTISETDGGTISTWTGTSTLGASSFDVALTWSVAPTGSGSVTITNSATQIYDLAGNAANTTPTASGATKINAAITAQPTAPAAFCETANSSLTVSTTGTTLAYQWQYNKGTAGAFIDIPLTDTDFSNTTSATLNLLSPPYALFNGTQFRVVVSNSCNSVTSNTVTLAIKQPVAIATQPTSTINLCRSTVTISQNLTGSATGAGTINYQWEYSATGLGGWASVANNTPTDFKYTNATTATLTIADDNTTITDKMAPGTYYFRLRAESAGASGCAGTYVYSNVVTFNIFPQHTADAGADQTVCATSPTVNLTGTIGNGATSFVWSGGNGTYNPNNTTLSASYTPTAAEILAGTVTLTLTTQNPSSPCVAASDAVTITINPAATVNAGVDMTVCGNQTAQLAGTRGGAATSSTWTTSGTGTFNDASLVNAVYTPSAGDKANGSVTLTLTTNDPTGPCGSVTDNLLLTILPTPTVYNVTGGPFCAGSNITVGLSGSQNGASYKLYRGANLIETQTGTGNALSFFVNSAETGTYTITTGACEYAMSGSITVNPAPTVNAGIDGSTCSNVAYTLAVGEASASNYASISWAHDGFGTITNGNTLTPTYTPHVNDAGTNVTLALTATALSGCVNVQDHKVLAIYPAAPSAPAVAGTTTICSGASTTLTASAANAVSYRWYTASSGGTLLYTGAAYEVTPMATTTYYVEAYNGCGISSRTATTVTVNVTPNVVITNPAVVCAGSTVDLTAPAVTAGSTAGLTYTYHTDAAGTITLANPNAVAVSGTYYIKGTNLCSNDIEAVVVTINPAVTATIDGDATSCSGSNTNITVTFTGTAPFAFTYTDGVTPVSVSGVNSNPYTFQVAPTVSTTYFLTAVSDAYSCVGTYSGSAIKTVNPIPTAAISGTASICAGTSTNLSVAFTGTGPWTFVYAIGGVNQTAITTSSNPYTISVTPSASTVYTLASVNTTCTGTVSGTATVTVKPLPNATISGNTSFCTGGSTVLSVTHVAGNTYLWSNSATTNSITVTTPGTYSVVVTNDGCSVTSSNVVVTENPVPTATISGTTSICNGSSATLTVALTGGAPYSITYTDGTTPVTVNGINTNSHTITVSPTSTTVYTVTNVSTTCTGTTSGFAIVTVNPIPNTPVLGSNTYTYDGTPKTATVTVGSGESVVWYAAATGSTLGSAPTGTNFGTYTAYASARNNTTLCESARIAVTLTINKANVAFTLSNNTKTYTGVAQSATITSTPTLVAGTDYTVTGNTGTNANTYPITIALLNNNYNMTTAGAIGNLVINKVALNVTADNKSKCVGATNPTLTVTYSGFVNSETSIVLTGTPSITRATGETAGTYTITPTVGTLAATNYTFTFVNGTFTINALPTPTITGNATVTTNTALNLSTGSFTTYSWSATGSPTSSGTSTANASFTWTTAGSYTVTLTVTNANGCSNTTTHAVTVTSGGGAATKYAITHINGTAVGSDVIIPRGSTFSVTVQTQNAGGTPTNPSSNLSISFSAINANPATLALGGTTTGTITTSENTKTFSGISITDAAGNGGQFDIQVSGGSLTADDNRMYYLATEPTSTEQTKSIMFTNTNPTYTTVSWTASKASNANYGRLLIIRKYTNELIDPSQLPVDGTSYSVNSAYGSGYNFNNDAYAIYDVNNGTQNVTVTNLEAGQTTHFRLFEYRWQNGIPQTKNYRIQDASLNPRTITMPSKYGIGFGIELADFNAKSYNGMVGLNWATKYESGIAGFELYRVNTNTEEDFSLVSSYMNDNKLESDNKASSYRTIDNNNLVVGDEYIYKLSAVTYDGTRIDLSEQSVVVNTMPNADAELFVETITPNPVRNVLNLNFQLAKSTEVSIEIRDMSGRLIGTVANAKEFGAGRHNVQFNMTNNAAGNYIITVTAGMEAAMQTFIYMP